MQPENSPAPADVYLLADNLDTALAAGEDLLKLCVTWQAGNARLADEVAAKRAEERRVVEEIRTLEAIVVARALKSRERARALAKHDRHMKPLAKLYNAGTSLLADVVKEFGEASAHRFDTGSGLTAYLRSRGLLAADAAAPSEAASLAVNEGFLIGGRIPLGTLMDLIAMFLDTLEIHYDLFETDDQTARGAAPAAPASAEAAV